MKLRYVFIMPFIICFNAISFANNDSLDTLSDVGIVKVEYLDTFQSTLDINMNPQVLDSLPYTTALINALNDAVSIQNNSINLIAIIVAIIGVLATFLGIGIAVIGYIRFKDLKDDINEYKSSINANINRISNGFNEHKEDMNRVLKHNDDSMDERIVEIKKEIQNAIKEVKNGVDEKIKKMDGLAKKQEFQNQYLKRINEYLYSITNSVVDSYGKKMQDATVIRENLYNQYYIVKVFLPWSNSPKDGTEAAFMNLKVSGTEENINDLQFIANNDLDEKKRKLAQETIGYIKARLMSGQAW